jgi:hypothetical protein
MEGSDSSCSFNSDSNPSSLVLDENGRAIVIIGSEQKAQDKPMQDEDIKKEQIVKQIKEEVENIFDKPSQSPEKVDKLCRLLEKTKDKRKALKR